MYHIYSYAYSYISFDRSLRVHSKIDSVCLYHDPQTNSWTFAFILNLWCFASMDSSWQALQTNGKLFFKFQIRFRIIGRKQKKKIFKRIARREYWSKGNVLYINGLVSTSSTNQCEAFFKSSESFFELTRIF